MDFKTCVCCFGERYFLPAQFYDSYMYADKKIEQISALSMTNLWFRPITPISATMTMTQTLIEFSDSIASSRVKRQFLKVTQVDVYKTCWLQLSPVA